MSRHNPADGPVAVIDCGSNSTRLLVVDHTGSSLLRLTKITRLAQSVDAIHVLSPTAMQRTLAVLREFRQEMDRRHVARARLIATSAVRDARNGESFLLAAAQVAGCSATLLSGEDEGRLAFLGATIGLEPGPGDDVVIDIGGGSTELIVGRSGSVNPISLPLGCVRLTERYFDSDPPSPGQLLAATEAIKDELQLAVRGVPVLAALKRNSRLIGLAGTVSTLSVLSQGLTHYETRLVHHSLLHLSEVNAWLARLASQPSRQRTLQMGIDPGRSDVIVAGALVLQEVMHHFDLTPCLVSESDILDGVALQLLI